MPVVYDTDGHAAVAYWYFLYNLTLFYEIFIYRLGKRDKLATWYLPYHHVVLPISTWWIIKFSPGGQGMYFGFINCIVHIIECTYLMLILTYPEIKKHLGWYRSFHNYMSVSSKLTLKSSL